MFDWAWLLLLLLLLVGADCRTVAMRSRPARREMRSARSASRVVVEALEEVEEVWRCAWW